MEKDQQLPTELKGFIFDIGQVLIHWDSRRIWQQIIQDESELQQQIKFFQPFLYLADAGVSYPMIIEILAAIMPQKAEQLRFWWQHWPDAFAGEIAGTVAIVRELKALGYPLYILSNFSLETMALVEDRIPCLQLFDGKLLSGAEGLVKPQAEIYQRCIDRFGLERIGAQHFLFIDDLADNIAAAQKAGLQGHLFSDPQALRWELEQRSVLLAN